MLGLKLIHLQGRGAVLAADELHVIETVETKFTDTNEKLSDAITTNA